MEEEKQIQKTNKIPLLNFIPIIFIIVIIPLITYGKIIELPYEEANFWKGGSTHVDFFSYYKSTFLIIAACLALLSFMDLVLKRKITLQNEKKYYVPMFIYALFVILSTLFSSYRNVALLGFIDMYQGMSVLLSYILLTFVTMNFLNTERDMKIIIFSLIFLTVIVGILGLSQYFGYDLLQTGIGKKLIMPEVLEDANVRFTFGKYTIYATMYNTNFVGSFGALVLPVSVFMFLGSKEKKPEFIYLISSILSYTTWLGCNSRAGYLGIIVAGIMGIILFYKLIIKKYKKLLLLLFVYFVITIIFNSFSNGKVLWQFYRLSPVTEVEKLMRAQEERKVLFEDISILDNALYIKTATEELKVTADNLNLSFYDNKGNELKTLIDEENNITFEDHRFKDYIFKKAKDSPFIKAIMYKRPLTLYLTEENNIKIISINYKLTEPVKAEQIRLFDGKETFASNRGYIWSRSIPMLKDTMLIGYGPDNYCLIFPQEDYVGRFNTGTGMTNIVVDKPHNMYLQIAINTGVISLLALVSIWGFYLIDSIKLYKNIKIESMLEYLGAACFLSITAYLVAGIFNDNIVSVAPLFWIILGAGISTNKVLKLTIS